MTHRRNRNRKAGRDPEVAALTHARATAYAEFWEWERKQNERLIEAALARMEEIKAEKKAKREAKA